jgi:membrane protein DedA with SNARE-associated domain
VADAFLDWLASLPTLLLYVVLALLSAVENVFPPVPADVAVALGAFLAQRGDLSAPLLGVVCWLANTASAAWMYFVGRTHGEWLMRAGWARRFMPPDAMEALRETFARYGIAGVFVSRFLPGVRAAVTPFAGVMGMRPSHVLIPAALASAIWYALIVVVGSMLGLHWARVRSLVDDASLALGIAGILSVVALVFWIRRRVRLRRAAQASSEGVR